jgi:hypothetical protein
MLAFFARLVTTAQVVTMLRLPAQLVTFAQREPSSPLSSHAHCSLSEPLLVLPHIPIVKPAQVVVSVSKVPKPSSIAHQAKIAQRHLGTVVIVSLVLTPAVAVKIVLPVNGAQLPPHTV